MRIFYNNIGIGILVGFLLSSAAVVFAWTGPSSPPPGSNVAAPINVGSTEQTKSGSLIIDNILEANDLSIWGSMILGGTGNYLNFGTTAGSAGYGIRDNAGVMEFKNNAGTWASLSGQTAPNGGLLLPTSVNVTTCDAASEGTVRYNSGAKRLDFCNGTAWAMADFSELISDSFTTAGTHSYVVPAGVSFVTVKAWGAGGGGGVSNGGSTWHGGMGAGGGYARATIAVTPGETLTVLVGTGGAKGSAVTDGGNGGGFSAVRRGASTYLVIAGGGGGGGGGWNVSTSVGISSDGLGGDGGGGVSGAPQNCMDQYYACGGSQTAGGLGQDAEFFNPNGTPGGNGISLRGGNGGGTGNGGAGGTGGGGSGSATTYGGGGGGGGGYFGGGGGQNGYYGNGSGGGGGGGAGGSGYVTGTDTILNTGSAGYGDGSGQLYGGPAANNSDADYTGNAGQGGIGAATVAGATAGNPGLVVIIPN